MSNHTTTPPYLTGTLHFGAKEPNREDVDIAVERWNVTKCEIIEFKGQWLAKVEYPNPNYVMSAMRLTQYRLENNLPFPDEDADYLEHFEY